MTDEQIIKAIENCCGDIPNCLACSFDEDTITCDKCMGKLLKNALDLINRQKAEIDILIRKKETLRDEIEEQQAEIERLREILDKRCDVCPAVITAIKEFAERLKDTICDKVNQSLDNPNGYDYYPIDVYKDIDNLVKETTEQSVNYGSSKITE